ncbi:hypothetical protein HYSC106933_02080 [Hydrogenibacillus schlegelii]
MFAQAKRRWRTAMIRMELSLLGTVLFLEGAGFGGTPAVFAAAERETPSGRKDRSIERDPLPSTAWAGDVVIVRRRACFCP